jgi:hypothetical protein
MRTFTLTVAASVIAAGPALAQPAPPAALQRGDVHVVIGWQNLRQDRHGDPGDFYNNWANGIFYGGAGAGWHWNQHLKTQVDFGAGTRGDHYRYRNVTINGAQGGEISRVTIQQQSVAVSQQYQFFRNQWFHPRVGAGLELARESLTQRFEPLIVYDPVLRTSRQIAAARTEGPATRLVARPFGEVGFKAYMTRRAFFTTDVRLMARSGIDEVLFRLGFGVDF